MASASSRGPRRIMEMACAFYESQVLFAASDLGVFACLDRLGHGTLGEVAGACGLDSRGGRLLLDACVAVGLLDKNVDGRYANSAETAAHLVPGRPGDLSRAIRYNRDVYAAWGNVKELAATGEPVERPELHLGEDEPRTRAFVLSMHARALGIGRCVVPHLDLAGRTRLLDVGGGPGTYSVLAAQANEGLQATVLDLPAVTAVAAELIEQAGMSERVTCLPGDYHETSFPEGNDAVTMFGMLHQEAPEAIQDLLRRAFEALAPGGRIYVLDMMTDETRTAPRFSALFAVNMALTSEHGWVFSRSDLEQWMTTAGFGDFECRPLPPPMPHWLASAVKSAG